MFNNFIWIVLGIILVSAYIAQVIMNFKEKKERDVLTKIILLVPVYGYLWARRTNKEDYTFDSFKRQYLIIVRLLFIIYIFYLLIIGPFFIKNNLLQTLVQTFVVILLIVTHQGLVVDFAKKKGYEGIVPGLLGLIPIYGFAYYVNAKPRRNITKKSLYDTFKISKIAGKMLIYAELILLAVIIIVPVVYIVGLSLSNFRTDIPNTIWPDKISFDSFKYLFTETNFATWYKNTLLIALVNMVFGTVLITGAAYVFARFKFKGKRAGLLTLLVLQAFPSFMGLIAMVALFMEFGLLGQPLALSILYIGGSIPGNLWLIKGFLDQIPRDLDESAMIDGANKLQIFSKIILPLSVPILSFVAVSMFMGPWMDYMLPGYILAFPPVGASADYDITQQWTLAVGLFKFVNDQQQMNYSAFAAGALIVGFPITVLYMVFQKYLIEGIMAGATKG